MKHITILALFLTGCASQIKVVNKRPNDVRIAPEYFIKDGKVIMYVPKIEKL